MVSANPRFHKSEEQFRAQGEKVIRNAVKEDRITTRDEELLGMFISETRATANISNSRASKIIGLLVGSRRWIGPFAEVDTPQLYQAVDRINNYPEFTRNTKADVSRNLKRFFLWLSESGYASPGLQVEKVRRIKAPTYQASTKCSDDLLTEDEVRLLIEHANNSRNRALIAMLYEGGFRIGEIGELTWRQVQFTDWNVAIQTAFKTGKERRIPLVMSRSYLQSYANEFRGKMSPDSFVFLTKQGSPLQYQALVKMIRQTAERAGVTRHITPHLFRHARITHLIRQGYQESVIKRMMWGSVESSMFRTYLHLCDADVDAEIAQKLGIRSRGRPTEASRALEPLQCPRCYTVNAPTHRFCDQCGSPLTKEIADTMQSLISDLESDPRYKMAQEAAIRALMDLGTGESV